MQNARNRIFLFGVEVDLGPFIEQDSNIAALKSPLNMKEQISYLSGELEVSVKLMCGRGALCKGLTQDSKLRDLRRLFATR